MFTRAKFTFPIFSEVGFGMKSDSFYKEGLIKELEEEKDAN